MQLSLGFLEIPKPHREVWEQLGEAQREALLERLAQLIAKAAVAKTDKEKNDDE